MEIIISKDKAVSVSNRVGSNLFCFIRRQLFS